MMNRIKETSRNKNEILTSKKLKMLSRILSTLLAGVVLGVTNTAKLVKCEVLQIVIFSSVIGIVCKPSLLHIELLFEAHPYCIFCKFSLTNCILVYKNKLVDTSTMDTL